jgi:hypothetical protein
MLGRRHEQAWQLGQGSGYRDDLLLELESVCLQCDDCDSPSLCGKEGCMYRCGAADREERRSADAVMYRNQNPRLQGPQPSWEGVWLVETARVFLALVRQSRNPGWYQVYLLFYDYELTTTCRRDSQVQVLRSIMEQYLCVHPARD